jgi:hypothetical protein
LKAIYVVIDVICTVQAVPVTAYNYELRIPFPDFYFKLLKELGVIAIRAINAT